MAMETATANTLEDLGNPQAGKSQADSTVQCAAGF